jgi:predicted lysophospholipase L1 biosynthesis ABC-type transport system permease subunit
MKIRILLVLCLAFLAVAKYRAEIHAKQALGGDIEIVSHIPAQTGTTAFLGMHSRAKSQVVTVKLQAESAYDLSKATPVIIKAKDKYYPLYGKLEVRDKKPGRIRRGKKNKGAAISPSLLSALEIGVGKRFHVEGTTLTVDSVLVHEPDGDGSDTPHIIVNKEVMKSLLKQVDDQNVTYRYRALLDKDYDLDELKQTFVKQFGYEPWIFYDWREKMPAPLRLLNWPVLIVSMIVAFAWLLAGLLAPRKKRRVR